MDNTPNLQKVVEILKAKGWTDEQIANMSSDLMKKASSLLYTSAIATFTEEDMVAIEACETDEDANKKILELFQLRTGKNPQEELNGFLTKFAEEFIKGQDEVK